MESSLTESAASSLHGLEILVQAASVPGAETTPLLAALEHYLVEIVHFYEQVAQAPYCDDEQTVHMQQTTLQYIETLHQAVSSLAACAEQQAGTQALGEALAAVRGADLALRRLVDEARGVHHERVTDLSRRTASCIRCGTTANEGRTVCSRCGAALDVGNGAWGQGEIEWGAGDGQTAFSVAEASGPTTTFVSEVRRLLDEAETSGQTADLQSYLFKVIDQMTQGLDQLKATTAGCNEGHPAVLVVREMTALGEAMLKVLDSAREDVEKNSLTPLVNCLPMLEESSVRMRLLETDVLTHLAQHPIEA